MSTLLHIDSSLFSAAGESSRLAARFVETWKASHPQGRVLHRDLASQPLPHLDQERFNALVTPAEARSPAQAAVAAESDLLVEELRQADTVVMGLPMYNFGIPSTLKAYFDHVARAGVTFRYTEQGPQGLLTGKEVYVLAARGGKYQGTPRDTQTRYVSDFLEFLGMGPVRFIYAEGLAMGEEQKSSALEQAELAVQRQAA